jgi:hypothetical protein
VVAFLAASALVARVVGAGSAARHDVVERIKRQPHSGQIDVLRVDGLSSFLLSGRTETVRVAWKDPSRLPVVQCVRIQRTGDPISGYDSRILHVSRPIGREDACPR